VVNAIGVKKRNGDLVHTDNNEIFIFDFEFDEQLIKDTFERDYRGRGVPYVDPRLKGMDEIIYGDDFGGWQIYRDVDFPYAWELIKFFGVDGLPRFFTQAPGFDLPQHTDFVTECAINLLIGNDLAPIDYGKNKYYYKSALINVQEHHGVINPTSERLLFKIAIQDEPYASVKEKVKKALSTLTPGF
jgi:hypothetical protein